MREMCAETKQITATEAVHCKGIAGHSGSHVAEHDGLRYEWVSKSPNNEKCGAATAFGNSVVYCERPKDHAGIHLCTRGSTTYSWRTTDSLSLKPRYEGKRINTTTSRVFK